MKKFSDKLLFLENVSLMNTLLPFDALFLVLTEPDFGYYSIKSRRGSVFAVRSTLSHSPEAKCHGTFKQSMHGTVISLSVHFFVCNIVLAHPDSKKMPSPKVWFTKSYVDDLKKICFFWLTMEVCKNIRRYFLFFFGSKTCEIVIMQETSLIFFEIWFLEKLNLLSETVLMRQLATENFLIPERIKRGDEMSDKKESFLRTKGEKRIAYVLKKYRNSWQCSTSV